MEDARKGKVRVDELKRAGDEIRHFTGWNDPVDTLSAFAQVNAQDILVEEKRNKVEEVNLAKRHETQEQERREMEKDAPESKEADKVKGKTNPAFQLASDTEDVMDIKHVTMEVTRGCVITHQDLDSNITNVAGIKKINDIGILEEDRSHYTKNHWTQTTMEAPIKIAEQQIPCINLMDHG